MESIEPPDEQDGILSASIEVDDSFSEHIGTSVGPYKLMELIGQGGFGLVFVAEQLQPVRRKVALKLIKPGTGTREVVARFEAERQALALITLEMRREGSLRRIIWFAILSQASLGRGRLRSLVVGEIRTRLRQVGLQPDRLLKLGLRFGLMAVGGQDHTQIRVGGRRTLDLRERLVTLLVAAEFSKRQAQIDPSPLVVG